MRSTNCILIVLCCIIFVSCFKTEEAQQQSSCLLQVEKHAQLPPIQTSGGKSAALLEASHQNAPELRQSTKHQQYKFNPAMGEFATLNATIVDGDTCTEDSYQPSQLEQEFFAHAVNWTTDADKLCRHLGKRDTWIQENLKGKVRSGDSIWSTMCKKGHAPQRIEPLAGILRDPRMICDSIGGGHFFGIDWLVLSDYGQVENSSPKDSEAGGTGFMDALAYFTGAGQVKESGKKKSKAKKSGKRILFDAGGTRFMDAMAYFTGHYELRGIDMDHIYVWEAQKQGTEAYWEEVPDTAREFWEPKLDFYDGIPVSADPKSDNNPVNRILSVCQPEDFCSFKLDIDTPEVELPIIDQLLAEPKIGEVLDEFFFEHHVAGLMQGYGWGNDVNGTYADSYRIFTKLRKMGVRAHSWI